ncbi:hypothetical protein D6855_09065 [Butyrivibrio sp. CB08]|nr:hypothetical protein D6855_09065 [Butyrivibrio sp. CB08]
MFHLVAKNFTKYAQLQHITETALFLIISISHVLMKKIRNEVNKIYNLVKRFRIICFFDFARISARIKKFGGIYKYV